MAKLEFKKLSVEETSELAPRGKTGFTKYVEVVDVCKTLLTGESIQINIPFGTAPESFRTTLRNVVRKHIIEYKFITTIFGGTLLIKRIG